MSRKSYKILDFGAFGQIMAGKNSNTRNSLCTKLPTKIHNSYYIRIKSGSKVEKPLGKSNMTPALF